VKTLLFILCLWLSWPHAAFAGTWQSEAIQLTGEDISARQAAATKLKKLPGLDKKLAKALSGSDRALALITIKVLDRSSTTPALLKAAKSTPDDWHLLLTLNSVAPQAANKNDVAAFYRQILGDKTLGSAAEMAVLAGLRSLGEKVSAAKLEELFSASSFDVRQEALNSAGPEWLNGSAGYGDLLRKALSQNPYQLRLSALSWLEKAPESMRAPFRNDLYALLKDENSDVRTQAAQLYEQAGGSSQ
jgi:hypothetical protein